MCAGVCQVWEVVAQMLGLAASFVLIESLSSTVDQIGTAELVLIWAGLQTIHVSLRRVALRSVRGFSESRSQIP